MKTNMFIDEKYINSILEQAKDSTDEQINDILNKANQFKGLTHLEVASLLTTKNPKHIERIFEIAGKIKQHIYGDRVVMFAPLYVSDYCVNKCSYCGFRCDNDFERRRLTMDEIKQEVRLLEKMGHKRIALEAGEDPVNCDIDYILESMKTIYDMNEDGEIRRINVNIAATTVQNYRKLKDADIGTYILFQETYHKPTYENVHIAGPKSNYEYHLTAMNRAMEGGIDDVGGGVLFGLYDASYEVLGLMIHNEHLEEKFGVGFHTISSPRLCKADGMDTNDYPNILSDDEFLKIVAIIRIAVPFTGMIISTRENIELRKKLIKIGISQISAGSSVEVGGYQAREHGGSQFKLADDRGAQDIISWLMEEDFIPSFCTACYRNGRTGDRFMQLAKSGDIKNVCLPNALMTLQEYALDYGNDEFKANADKIITKHIDDIDSNKVKTLVKDNLEKLKKGQRDLFV